MIIDNIVRFVNEKLAGEMLTYDEMLIHLDSVIDDINTKLSSKFPAFSEFTPATHASYPDYNFFPDKYIRSVIFPGVAYKYYTTDEEGIPSAMAYQIEYEQNKFYMLRDYGTRVTLEYQDLEQGYYPNDPRTDRGLEFYGGTEDDIEW